MLSSLANILIFFQLPFLSPPFIININTLPCSDFPVNDCKIIATCHVKKTQICNSLLFVKSIFFVIFALEKSISSF